MACFISQLVRQVASVAVVLLLAGASHDTPAWAQDTSMDNNAIAHLYSGQQWLEYGHPHTALHEFALGIALKPSSPLSGALYTNLGKAYERLNQSAQAQIAYEKAMALLPQDEAVFEAWSNLIARQGKLSAVLKTRAQQLASAPEANVTGWYQLGLLAARAKDWPQAADAMRRYALLAPESPLAGRALYWIETWGASQAGALSPKIESPL